MRAHSILLCALSSAVVALPTIGTSAPAVVAAADYGLQVTHAEVSKPATTRVARTTGRDLQLSIVNRGSHDLFDVRIYLQQIGAIVIVDRQQPALLQSLPRGAMNTIAWTFEPRRSLNNAPALVNTDPLRDVVFRVEAVDKSTQQIVKFYVKSKEPLT